MITAPVCMLIRTEIKKHPVARPPAALNGAVSGRYAERLKQVAASVLGVACSTIIFAQMNGFHRRSLHDSESHSQ